MKLAEKNTEPKLTREIFDTGRYLAVESVPFVERQNSEGEEKYCQKHRRPLVLIRPLDFRLVGGIVRVRETSFRKQKHKQVLLFHRQVVFLVALSFVTFSCLFLYPLLSPGSVSLTLLSQFLFSRHFYNVVSLFRATADKKILFLLPSSLFCLVLTGNGRGASIR